MAHRRDTSCTGASIADKTINISTRAALGTEAEAMLAAVEVNLKNFILKVKLDILKLKTYTTVA